MFNENGRFFVGARSKLRSKLGTFRSRALYPPDFLVFDDSLIDSNGHRFAYTGCEFYAGFGSGPSNAA